MKKLVILLILLAAVVFTAGCTEESQVNSTNTQENSTNIQGNQDINGVVEATESGQTTTPRETQNEGSVVEVTDFTQINASLQQGPVLMKFGSERCGACKAMKPMLQELATEYEGRANVISVDIDKSPQLAEYFNISYIPDSTVILNVTDGEYVYMKSDDSITTDRFQARILGSTEKGVLEDIMNLALLHAEK
jgi:thiol-disulfide isomerase/thioredoxin